MAHALIVEPCAPAAQMPALDIRAADPATLPIASISRDMDLVCRASGINKRTVAEYSASMKAGASFPPVVVFDNGKGSSWLADGFHRCAAAEAAGLVDIAVDVRKGSRRDALLYAASANSQHGLRRTNADKRRAVLLLIEAFPKWSDRKIGAAAGVHNETVAAGRKQVTESVTPEAGAASDEATPDGAAAADALIARLSLVLSRVVAQWPAERRGELQALVAGTTGGGL
jgi:ParB-like chromosome segregation protein Spo0J